MSLQLLENVDLTARNGLRLPARARYYAVLNDIDELPAIRERGLALGLPILVMGEGSNLVLTADINALVVSVEASGVKLHGDQVTVAAGENWHELVARTVSEGYYGLENLALIPGTAGAAPVQNIGAYGVELADRLTSLDAFSLETGTFETFSAQECGFGYRDSRFKREPGWIITSLTLQLNRQDSPVLGYPGLMEWLASHQLPGECRNVFAAVVALRQAKLPDPLKIPNVGSFFKNPVVPAQTVARIGRSDMPVFEAPDHRVKLSAAWLIDQCGLKGERSGGISVSPQHALVLINDGNGRGDDLIALVQRVRSRVERNFGIRLEVEPAAFPVDLNQL